MGRKAYRTLICTGSLMVAGIQLVCVEYWIPEEKKTPTNFHLSGSLPALLKCLNTSLANR